MRPTRYRNLSGDSGVTRYAIGADHIEVQFDGPVVYTYDATRPGVPHVERMKLLAVAGRGLSTYISTHVKNEYSRKRTGW
jgi:hypothetical protein